MAQMKEINALKMLKRGKPEDNRHGREPEALYPALVKAFLSQNEESMEIDIEMTGKKPLTLRQGLNNALKTMKDSKGKPLFETVKVSLRSDGKMYLMKRKTK